MEGSTAAAGRTMGGTQQGDGCLAGDRQAQAQVNGMWQTVGRGPDGRIIGRWLAVCRRFAQP